MRVSLKSHKGAIFGAVEFDAATDDPATDDPAKALNAAAQEIKADIDRKVAAARAKLADVQDELAALVGAEEAYRIMQTAVKQLSPWRDGKKPSKTGGRKRDPQFDELRAAYEAAPRGQKSAVLDEYVRPGKDSEKATLLRWLRREQKRDRAMDAALKAWAKDLGVGDGDEVVVAMIPAAKESPA